MAERVEGGSGPTIRQGRPYALRYGVCAPNKIRGDRSAPSQRHELSGMWWLDSCLRSPDWGRRWHHARFIQNLQCRRVVQLSKCPMALDQWHHEGAFGLLRAGGRGPWHVVSRPPVDMRDNEARLGNHHGVTGRAALSSETVWGITPRTRNVIVRVGWVECGC